MKTFEIVCNNCQSGEPVWVKLIINQDGNVRFEFYCTCCGATEEIKKEEEVL